MSKGKRSPPVTDYKFEDGGEVFSRGTLERGKVMDRRTEFNGSNSYFVKWQRAHSAYWYAESALTTE